MTTMAPTISQPTDTNKTWFFVNNGVADGPHESDTLVQLYIQRMINDETLVWCAGEPSWRALGSYATLTEHVRLILSGPPARKRLRTDGEAKLSCNFRKWLRDLDENALMSVLFKAIKWYAPQVVQGREAARDALVLAYQQRTGSRGDPESSFQAMLAEAKSPPELWKMLGHPVNMDAVESIIEAAAQLDSSFQKQVQAIWEIGWLWKLLEKGAVETLIPTLKSKPEVLSMKNAKGRTLVHTAACNNNIAFIQRCREERLFSPQLVNAADAGGNTPLHLAVEKGHEIMVVELLHCGALVNIQNRDSNPYSNGSWSAPPHPSTTAPTPHPIPPRLLNRTHSTGSAAAPSGTSSTTNPGMLQGGSLPTPGMVGVSGNTTMSNGGGVGGGVGGAVYSGTNNHNTPVHVAAEQGHASILEELLKHGANLGIRNGAGKTALQCAVEAEDSECVELLLHAGADASIVLTSSHNEFTTPLHWAATQGNTRLVTMMLRGRKCNVNLSNSQGWTPLQLAARRGELQCVKLLLEAGANVHAKTQAGKTPLELAEANGRGDVVPVLREYEERGAGGHAPPG